MLSPGVLVLDSTLWLRLNMQDFPFIRLMNKSLMSSLVLVLIQAELILVLFQVELTKPSPQQARC